MRTVALAAAAVGVLGICACTTSGAGTPAPAGAGRTAGPTPTATTRSAGGPAKTGHGAAVTSSTGASTAGSTSASASATSGTGAATQTAAERAFHNMSEARRVGQLFMIDCPSSGVAGATVAAIRHQFVGSVILDGNSRLGVSRTRAITTQLQSYAPKTVRLFISTDQEGGLVQRMRGPGFSSIPSAVVQGGRSPSSLRTSAKTWGTQLRKAGINVDLAPVLDTVPPNSSGNPPIGDLDREYGRTPSAVSSHGVAVAQGLADAHVDATVKHFPGLGRVAGNTDTTSGVTDHVTTRHDAYLAPFKAAIAKHIPFVMMSTAIYSRIDPQYPAAFSKTIITGMLRGDLRFPGVVISDDIGAAKQVSRYLPGNRAVAFVRAGGDMILTVDPHVVATMTEALLARAHKYPGFKKLIDAAALRVLQAKQARGLLS